MKTDNKIESIYQKIFRKVKDSRYRPLAYFAHFEYENEETKVAFLFELSEQLKNSRAGVLRIYGEDIVKDLEELTKNQFIS